MRLLLLVYPLALISCAVKTESKTSPLAPTKSYFSSSDGKRLPVQHWNLQAQPKTIILALHGIEGAAQDFKNLGKALSTQSPQTTLYALNLRGGGYDPTPQDRGNISSANLWKRDLLEFHRTLKKLHPKAQFTWLGESMGSLIAMNTVSETSNPPDKLILVSPVVSLNFIPPWQVASLKTASFLVPGLRVSLEALSGGSFQATSNSDHFTQNKTNPYYLDRYSLRYLRSIASLSEQMKQAATKTTLPTLILYGGKDFLTNETEIQEFTAAFPKKPSLHQFHASRHLLFFDKQKNEVIDTILKWVSQPTS